jgi:hypothetical protein
MVRNSQEALPDLISSLAHIAITEKNASFAKLALQINGLLTDKVEVETINKQDVNIDDLRAKINKYKQQAETEEGDQ